MRRSGGRPMNEDGEKRSTRRFARRAKMEIRGHTRASLRAKGVLIDCSKGGVGFYSGEALKNGEVVILRVCGETNGDASPWPPEAGRFNMITAKVRWCLESPCPEEDSRFRVGVQRMLPFY